MGTTPSDLGRQAPERLLPLNQDTLPLRAILDNLGEGIVVADAQGRFVVFNPVAERILGIGAQDISPAEWSSAYGCFRSDGMTPYPSEELPLARALRGESSVDELVLIRNPAHPAGAWISISGNPIRDDLGAMIGGLVIFKDITERASALEQISSFHSQYQRLAMAVHQTADSVVITDAKGFIEYVNPAFETTTGYSREEVVGQTPRVLKSGWHDEAFYRKLWLEISSGEHYRGTIVNRKKSGELYWAEQTITPLKDTNGRITNFVSVLKDVTELRAKERQDVQLSIAREIQQRFFPPDISVPGFDIAGKTYPAAETGGDYYDYIPSPDGAVWITVADVADHGIGSALIMAETRA